MTAPPTRAQLAQRRALVAAATKRRPARTVPRAQLPRPTQYTRALIDFAEELNAAVHDALSDEGLPAPRSDAADGAVPPFDKGDLLARLRRLAEKVVKRRGSAIDAAIQAVSANVSAVTKANWARQAKAVVGVDLSAVEPNLAPLTERFRRENLDLIVSMAKDKVSRVKAILDDAPNARVETIRDRILEEGAVTKRQAALIARDQVLSLNAQVTQRRHEAAGITRYVWRTSGDGDVRPDHRALNGKTFSYDDPPVVNASEVRRGRPERREGPGQDYQCRCTAEPVIEGLDEAAKADRRDAGDFKEGEHPRAKDGQFTAGAGGGPSQAKPPKPPARPPKGQPTTPSAPRAKPVPQPPAPAEGAAKLSDEEVARRRALRQATKLTTAEVFQEHNPTVQGAMMGRALRESVPPDVRARAVAYYQQMAEIPLGAWPDAFRQFNLHRAAFWAGQTDEAPMDINSFMARHNLPKR